MTARREAAVRRTYDGLAATWNDLGRLFQPRSEDNRLLKLARAELRRAGRHGPPCIAEFGTGSGKLLKKLMSAAPPGARFIGVDISPAMLAAADASLREPARARGQYLYLLESRASATPIPDDTCDICVAKHLWHHVSDPAAVAHEMYRVTKPGGIAIVMVNGPGYQRDFLFQGRRLATGVSPKAGQGHEDAWGRFSQVEVQEILEGQGFLHEATYTDYPPYDFGSQWNYLLFLVGTGARQKLLGYGSGSSALEGLPRGVMEIGPLTVRMEFITVLARKASG